MFFQDLFNIDPNSIVQCTGQTTCTVIHAFVFSALFLFVVITGFAYTTLLERKLIARLQHRVGPNRVGPRGLLQPAADGVKLAFKEDIVPSGAYKTVWMIAPILKMVPTLIVMAVIPLGPNILIPWFDGLWYNVPLGLADPNVGVLWLLAITSIGTYGVVLAGWASNNKYAMLGGIRASAQMISYELSLGITMTVPILIVGSMSIKDIIEAQASPPVIGWFIFQNPLAAAILMIALLAEVNRAPFDLPEAEQELTAGYMTEYSGMKFAMFMMAEYLGMIAVSLIAVSLFFGGYHFVLVDGAPITGPAIMIGKVVLLLAGMIWIRATLPRIRYDRLMAFGWKVMLPLSLLSVAWTAIAITIGETGNATAYGVVSVILFATVIVGGFVYLTRSGQIEMLDEEEELDPLITGEKRGVGYIILQIVGGLIGFAFLLWDVQLRMLRGLAQLGEPPEDAPQS
ncbi:MAG: NADH-quinone oxidoreductase subunit NuoH [Chloroflexi bacterium]|nr:MAG: NADH-quinone oxidoreductase subunit NuoH [Chloroflexota bacterium]